MNLPKTPEEYFNTLQKDKKLLGKLRHGLLRKEYFFKGTHYFHYASNVDGSGHPTSLDVQACLRQLEQLGLLLHVQLNQYKLHEDVKAFFLLQEL
jgi:hypothetical protein